MANYPRPPKPPDMWLDMDLHSYNIQIVIDKDAESFFEVSELPPSQHVLPLMWNNDEAPPGHISKDEKNFFALLRDVVQSPGKETSAPNDLAHFLLGHLGFDDDPALHIRTRKELEFVVAGKTFPDVTIDLAVLQSVAYYHQFLMLVQQDAYTDYTSYSVWSVLIAKAIAAFDHNNTQRQLRRQPLLESQTFPAIMMRGDEKMFFFKITVTPKLLAAVTGGYFPEEPTVVHLFDPLVHRKSLKKGDNRKLLFQCIEALKKFIVVPDFK